MFKKYLLQLKTHHLRALREQKGQSLIIFVFAILGIIAMMGLALDLGLVYIERVRVSRTTDAAALASVVELPFEEEAIRRAIEYIELNGYRQDETEIRVRGCIQVPAAPPPPSPSLVGEIRNVGEGEPAVVGGNAYGTNDEVDVVPDDLMSGYVYRESINPPTAIFVIDTLAYQPVSRNAGGDVITKNNENCDGSGTPLYGTANKLRVSGQVDVGMNFMQFFGREAIAVFDQAVGENVTNLDVVVVFDISGSMDYETNCFGCWKRDSPAPDIMTNPYPQNGTYAPLNYTFNETGGGSTSIFWDEAASSTAGHAACSAPITSKQIVEGGGGGPTWNYLVHEAEFYSRTYPENGWEFPKHRAGEGFWVLQRTSLAENASNNAYISAHPFVTYSQNNLDFVPQIQGGTYDSDCFAENPAAPGEYGTFGECWELKGIPDGVPNDPPYVEYDFTPDWTGDLHIWVRAIGGWTWSYEWDGKNPSPPAVTALAPYRTAIFWQIDRELVNGGEYPLLGRKTKRDEVNTAVAMGGRDKWRWVKIADEQNTPGVVSGQPHTLRIYQGSSGFNIDKIIITNNPEGDVFNAVVDDGRLVLTVTDDTDPTNAGTATSLDIAGNNLDIANDVLSLFDGRGPDVSDGSATREACNRCNPAYGQTVDSAQCTCRANAGEVGVVGSGSSCTTVTEPTDQLANDLFYDRAPLRNAKEAVKNFAARLDPKFDQLGVVAFNNVTPERTKLQCLVFGGFDTCATNTNAITYSFVIRDLEDYVNGDATNIAQGMREGLEELGVSVPGYNGGVQHDCPDPAIPIEDSASDLSEDNEKACDRRGGARRVLILMTDGTPSRWPGSTGSTPNDPGNCPPDSEVLWQGQIGAGNQAYDCAMFYAQEAARNNIVLYTIGIGAGVNKALLTAMATGEDDMGTPQDDTDDIEYITGAQGQFFEAATPDQLDEIFSSILKNIYVRIVG